MNERATLFVPSVRVFHDRPGFSDKVVFHLMLARDVISNAEPAQQHGRRQVGYESVVGGAGDGRFQAVVRVADQVDFRLLELLGSVVLDYAMAKGASQ